MPDFESRIAESLEQTLREHELSIDEMGDCTCWCLLRFETVSEWRSHLSSIAAKKVVEMAIATIDHERETWNPKEWPAGKTIFDQFSEAFGGGPLGYSRLGGKGSGT